MFVLRVFSVGVVETGMAMYTPEATGRQLTFVTEGSATTFVA